MEKPTPVTTDPSPAAPNSDTSPETTTDSDGSDDVLLVDDAEMEEEEEEASAAAGNNSPSSSSAAATATAKYVCPERSCGRQFSHAFNFRTHYRASHSTLKPYSCSFPACHRSYTQSSHLVQHICGKHNLVTREEAKQYMKVNKKLVAEETKLLGIRSYKKEFVGGSKNEDKDEDDDNANDDDLDDEQVAVATEQRVRDEALKMPHFDVIYRNFTADALICPFEECDLEFPEIGPLKRHYRTHGDYRPYRCIFNPQKCQFSAKNKSNVTQHLRNAHATLSNKFVETHHDWLKAESALFNRAKVINSLSGAIETGRSVAERPNYHSEAVKGVRKHRPYMCPMEKCGKQFPTVAETSRHYRIHTGVKPFFCRFPACCQMSAQKNHVYLHVLSVHYGLSLREHKEVSADVKMQAITYVGTDDAVLQEDEQIVMAFNKSSLTSRKLNVLGELPLDTIFIDDDEMVDSPFSSADDTASGDEQVYSPPPPTTTTEPAPASTDQLEPSNSSQPMEQTADGNSDGESEAPSSSGDSTPSAELLAAFIDDYDPYEDEVEDDSREVAMITRNCIIVEVVDGQQLYSY